MTDYNIHSNIHEQHELRQKIILALTKDEKTKSIKELNKVYDLNKVMLNEGTKRACENCSQECLATLYCELSTRDLDKTANT
jgi:hypothetical protein